MSRKNLRVCCKCFKNNLFDNIVLLKIRDATKSLIKGDNICETCLEKFKQKVSDKRKLSKSKINLSSEEIFRMPQNNSINY